jgi:hypothetical protein
MLNISLHEDETWFNKICKCSPEVYIEEKEKFLENLESHMFFNIQSQLNTVVRKTQKNWTKRPFTIVD